MWFLAALAGGVSSCASVDAHSKQYAGVPQLPPSEPASVQVLRSAPNQPYQKLGEIVVDASTMPDVPDQKVEAKLKEEAAKLGADAAVVVVDRIQPEGLAVTGAYWNRTVDTVDERKVVAVAIKYGTLTPTGRP